MNAIYARQSLDKKDSISIETQIDFCLREVRPGEAHKVYEDKGFSGKNIDRPAFGQLLSDIESGKVSRLIVYRLDRISRSIVDFAGIIDRLEKADVAFVSANEKFDTSTPVGRAMLYIIIVFAQMERETLAERIRDNYYSRGRTGVWLGGPAPLGFDNTKVLQNGKTVSTISPNTDIAIVIKIFNTYANTSASLGSIAKTLSKEHNQMFNNIKLARILQNPAYVRADVDIFAFYKSKNCIVINDIEEFTGVHGCNLYSKRDSSSNKYNLTEQHVLSIAMHEGIIDSDTFLRCQEKLRNNRQIKNTGKGKHTWLTGLVKCGFCGYTMNARIYGKYRYLKCRGREISKCTASKMTSQSLTDIENAVTEHLTEALEILRLQGISGDDGVAEHQETNNEKMELYAIEEEIKKLVDAVPSANDILIGYINERISELDKRKGELVALISSRRAPKPIKLPVFDNAIALSPEAKKDLAKALVSKIEVFENEIKISWKF